MLLCISHASSTAPQIIHHIATDVPCAIDSEAWWQAQRPGGMLNLAAGLPPEQNVFAGSARVTEAASLSDVNGAVRSGGPTVVLFYAAWCPHCKTTKPVFDRVAEKQNGVRFVQIDASAVSEVRSPFDVHAYPTIKYFDGSSAAGVTYDWHGADETDLNKFVLRHKVPGGAEQPPSESKPRREEPDPGVHLVQTMSDHVASLVGPRGPVVWEKGVWDRAFQRIKGATDLRSLLPEGWRLQQ